jgi:hypothetical protein
MRNQVDTRLGKIACEGSTSSNDSSLISSAVSEGDPFDSGAQAMGESAIDFSLPFLSTRTLLLRTP